MWSRKLGGHIGRAEYIYNGTWQLTEIPPRESSRDYPNVSPGSIAHEARNPAALRDMVPAFHEADSSAIVTISVTIW